MPYKYQIEKLKIPRSLDRRVRLTDQDKISIIFHWKQGEGIRAIARDYEGICSRRLIQFVIFPERYQKARETFKENRKDGRYYHGGEKWAQTMREHRAYKQSIKEKLL